MLEAHSDVAECILKLSASLTQLNLYQYDLHEIKVLHLKLVAALETQSKDLSFHISWNSANRMLHKNFQSARIDTLPIYVGTPEKESSTILRCIEVECVDTPNFQ